MVPHYRARAKKRDIEEPAIYSAIKRLGCKVKRCDPPLLDLLVEKFNKQMVWFEVKSEKGKLTPSQEEFIREWGSHVVVVRSVEEAIEALRK